MNKKGQTDFNLGMILIVFITIIVGVVLFQVVAQESGKSTSTVQAVNESLGDVVNGTPVYMITYRALSDVVILNKTDTSGAFTANATVIGSGNYTIVNNVIDPTTGGLAVRIDPTATTGWKSEWQVSATAQPTTYIAEGGARAMVSLIAIFFALAIAIVALTPTLKSKILESFGR